MIEQSFLTKTKFSKLIEDNVKQTRSSYMDAVIDICDSLDIDLEDCRKFISPTVKDKIEAEAMRLNFLPQGNTLPLEGL